MQNSLFQEAHHRKAAPFTSEENLEASTYNVAILICKNGEDCGKKSAKLILWWA